jgi:hypothetical protein
MVGYVKLWRKLLDSPIFTNHNLLVFWIWCLLKATHKEVDIMVGYQSVTLQPGQFVFGLKASSKETRLSIQKIRTCLLILKNLQNITIKTTNRYSLISIVNWLDYQGDITINSTISQQTNNKQITTNKNIKNDKNIKENNKRKVSDESLRLATLLKDLMLLNDDKARIPLDLTSWALEIDRINRLDHRSFEDIEAVIRFSQVDKFWKTNVLSANSLRNNFPKLYLQQKNGSKQSGFVPRQYEAVN